MVVGARVEGILPARVVTGHLVLEVGVENRCRHIRTGRPVVHQTKLLGYAGFGFEIWIPAERAAEPGIATRGHAVAGRALAYGGRLETGRHTALDRQRFIHMIYTVDTGRPVLSITIVVVHAHAGRHDEVISDKEIVFDE